MSSAGYITDMEEEEYFEMQLKIIRAKKQLDMQRVCIIQQPNSYNFGLYNGLLLGMSWLDDEFDPAVHYIHENNWKELVGSAWTAN